MATVLLILLIATVTAASVVAMAVARRRAPDGGYIGDSPAGGAVINTVGTGFAVLLAFVIFIAFGGYQNARREAGVEAVAVRVMVETANLLAAADRDAVQRALACYADGVVGEEWASQNDGRESPRVGDALEALEAAMGAATVGAGKQTVAFEQLLEEERARADGRRGRLAEATPLVPFLAWMLLLVAGGFAIWLVVLLADRAQRPLWQLAGVAGVTATVLSGLVLIWALDKPFADRGTKIEPTRMEAVIDFMAARGIRAEGC